MQKVYLKNQGKIMSDEKEHPHAKLMAVAAEIAKENPFWWEEFEFTNPALDDMGWMSLGLEKVMRFLPHLNYRLKSKEKLRAEKEHPHAKLMAIAAEMAKTNLFWWEEFEVNDPDIYHVSWIPMPTSETMTFLPNLKYRIKKDKIKIGNKEIPVPFKGSIYQIESGEKYYVPDLRANILHREFIVGDDEYQDNDYLKRGLIFFEKEAAIDCAKAIIDLLNGEYDDIG